MVYASVLQSPMEGAKADDVNTDEVMKIKGVTQVLPLPFGVAVVGDTVEATRAGRSALKVTWDTSGRDRGRRSIRRQAKEEYARKGSDPNAKAMESSTRSATPRTALAGAAKMLEATYWSEHCYHAQMEPMNASPRSPRTASRPKSGPARSSARSPPVVVAGVLKTTPDKINIHQHLLGGGYGRRIWPDAAVQAVVLVQHRQEAGEAHPHARGRRRGGAAAADDASRAEGGSRRQGQPRRLASPAGRRERRRGRRAAALPGDRRQGLSSAGAASSRSSTPSPTCSPRRCARSAACACMPGAASARATTSSRPSPSSTRSRTPRASIRSRCGSSSPRTIRAPTR